MHWLNQKIQGKVSHFIFQALLILFFVFASMAVLVAVENQRLGVLSAIGVSSLSSSAFICFGMPNAPTAKLYRVVLSYVVAIVFGISFHELPHLITFLPYLRFPIAMALTSALSVMLTMMVLTIFDWGHPPAIGLSLGLVVVEWDYGVICTIIGALIFLCIIRGSLRSWFNSLV